MAAIRFHTENPTRLIEAAFERIRAERMTGLPMLNPVLAVAAIGFERQEYEWRGVLLTPWGINLLLLPAAAHWPIPASHERVFREYSAGTFAFLGNREDDLGDYLACPLIHDMQQFADQATAVQTAHACLIALDLPRGTQPVAAPVSPSRRKLFGLRD